jgi:nitrite reductase/ring-hydroxylating ferredoxin subunit
MQLKLINKIVLLVAVVGLIGLTACTTAKAENVPAPSRPTPTLPASVPNVVPAGKIKATWIKAVIDGESVTVPVDEVRKDYIVHFPVETPAGKENFMTYVFDGQIYVRADICPPCRSINFSLEKDILSCDACGTRFDARTGEGVSGACVAYPKAAVKFETNGVSLVMRMADLQAAYQATLKPVRK